MGVDVVSGSSAACVSILGCSALDASAVALGSHGGHHLFINRIPPRLPKEDVERTILAQLKSLHVSRCSVIPQNSLKNKGYGFITLGGCPSPQDLDDIANALNNRLQIGSRVLGVRVCTDAHRELLGLIGVGPGPDGCGAVGCCDDGEVHHDDPEDPHDRGTPPCIGSISAAAHACLLVPHAVVGAAGSGSGLRSHRICTNGGPDVASEAGSSSSNSSSTNIVPGARLAAVCPGCEPAGGLGVGPVSHPAARSCSTSSITSSGTTTTYGSSGSSSGSSSSGSAAPSPAPSTAPTRCATPLPEDSGLASGPCPGFPCPTSGAMVGECVCGGMRGLQGGAGDAACVCGGRGAALHAADQVGRVGVPPATGRTCGARSDCLQRRCFGVGPSAAAEHTANGPCDKDSLLVAARSLSAPQPMPAAAVGQGHGAPGDAAEGREVGPAAGRVGCGSSTRGRGLTGGPTANGRGGSGVRGHEGRGQGAEAVPRRGIGRDKDREVSATAQGRRRPQQQLPLGTQAAASSRMARSSVHHAHSYDGHSGGYSGSARAGHCGQQEQKQAADRPAGAVANGPDAAAPATSVDHMHQHREAAPFGREQEQMKPQLSKHSVPCVTHSSCSSSNARQQLSRASAPAMGGHSLTSSDPHNRHQQQQMSSSPSQSVRRQGPAASAAGPSFLSPAHGPSSRHDLARRGRQPYGMPVQPAASMDFPGLACSPGHSPALFASSPSPAQARMGAGHTWGGRADGSRQGGQPHAHHDRHQQQYGQHGSVQHGGAAASGGRRQELARHSAPVAHPGSAHRRVSNWPPGPPPGLQQQQQQRQQGSFAVHHSQLQQQQHASAQRVTGTYGSGSSMAHGPDALHAQAAAGPFRACIQEEEQHIAGTASHVQARTSGRHPTASRAVPLAAATAPSASTTTAAALSSAVFGSPVCGMDMLAVGSLGRQGLAASLGAAGGLAGSFAYSYGSTPPYNRCSLDLMRPFLDTGDVDPDPLGTGGAPANEGAGGEADPLDLDPLDLEPMILQLLNNDDEDGEADRHQQQQQQHGMCAAAPLATSSFSLLDDGSSGASRPATWSLGQAAAAAVAAANGSASGGVFASPAATAAAAAQAVMDGGLAAAWQSGDVTAAAAAAVAHAVGSFGGLGGMGARGAALSSSVDLHMSGAWLERYYGSASGQVSASQHQQQQQQALLLARSSMPGAGYGDVGLGWDGPPPGSLAAMGSLGGLVGSFGGLAGGGIGGGGGDGWLGEVGLSQSLPSRLAVRALNSSRNGGGGRF